MSVRFRLPAVLFVRVGVSLRRSLRMVCRPCRASVRAASISLGWVWLFGRFRCRRRPVAASVASAGVCRVRLSSSVVSRAAFRFCGFPLWTCGVRSPCRKEKRHTPSRVCRLPLRAVWSVVRQLPQGLRPRGLYAASRPRRRRPQSPCLWFPKLHGLPHLRR